MQDIDSDIKFECFKSQFACCVIGGASSLLLCLPKSSGYCFMFLLPQYPMVMTGISLTTIGFTFGSTPVCIFAYKHLKRCRQQQVDHFNDNHTDVSS